MSGKIYSNIKGYRMDRINEDVYTDKLHRLKLYILGFPLYLKYILKMHTSVYNIVLQENVKIIVIC